MTQTGHSGLRGTPVTVRKSPNLRLLVRPHNLVWKQKGNGGHHVCAGIWRGISARWIELAANSGPWPCEIAAASTVTLKQPGASGLAGF